MHCSVIIPAFDSEHTIAATVRSVMQQSYDGWEIVIAADDGKDYSAILADQGIRHKNIFFTSTGGVGTGVASARNAALMAAKGRFIVSLDADDQLYPRALEVLLPYAGKYGAAYSQMDYVDHDTRQQLPNHNRLMPAGVKSLPEILSSNIHSFAWVVFDRQAHNDLKWPENIIRWEDAVFFATCCDKLGGMYYLPDPLYVYGRRQGSICNRAETGEEFSYWAEKLISLLEAKALGGISRKATFEVLVQYFKSRLEIEQAFISSGLDWPEFMQQNISMFYDFMKADYSPR